MRLSASRQIVGVLFCLNAVLVSAASVRADDRDPLSARRLNPSAQAVPASKTPSCRDQASSRGLTHGNARHTFLQQCLTRKRDQRLEREEYCRSQNATLPTAIARRQAFRRCLDKSY